MAFFMPKHSSAATARLTEDPDVLLLSPKRPPRAPSSKSKAHRHSTGTLKPDSPGKHRRLESSEWVDCDADDETGDDPAKSGTAGTLMTRSTSFSSSTDDSDDDFDSDDDDGGGASEVDSRSSGSSAGFNEGWPSLPDDGRDNDGDEEGRSVTSATTNSSAHSLTEMIGSYNDGDLQTLNQLVNKLHAVELERESRNSAKTPKIKNGRKSPPLTSPLDLPAELPEHPPHFSPLLSSHRLSISSVNSWRGPSLEIVPTDEVDGIMPLWRSQWNTDRREWEERKKTQDDLTFKRSRTHDDVRLSESTELRRRNRSLPDTRQSKSKIRRHNRVRHGAPHLVKHARRSHSTPSEAPSTTSSTRNYRYGKPPTLPNAKNPNPMVSKSSKKINRKHARYALTAGMMLGIRESVGGATGVENELEISRWENWERSWMEEALSDGEGGSPDLDESDSQDVEVDVDGKATPQEGGASQSQHGGRHNSLSSSPSRPPSLTTSDRLACSTLVKECDRVSKYKFPPHQFYLGSNTSRPLPHKYKFKVYAPLVFARIRSLFGVEKQTFLHSICGKFNFYEFASNARSGQFFFYSHDGRYMIKTLTYTESKFLREILPHYYRHLTRCPSTFLTHFYGMYRVCMPDAGNQRLHFIIMRSVFHTQKKIDRVWDLKGSRTGRKAGQGDGVGKDLDILEEGRRLRFAEKGARAAFLEQLARDATFLARLGIMDYSLLLGLHNREEEEADGNATESIAGPPVTPREGGKKEPARSNTPFRRGVLLRASSAGDTRVGDDGFKALESCGKGSSSSGGRRAEAPSSQLDAVLESTSTCSSVNSTGRETSSSAPRNLITSRSDMGIEGYGIRLADGTLAKREIYFCGIIDILQYYNARKMGETVIRKAAGNSGKDISCVDPETYGKRFVKFLSNLVEE